jgi:hypothetical protein
VAALRAVMLPLESKIQLENGLLIVMAFALATLIWSINAFRALRD